MDYLGQTGLDTLQGADILKDAPKMYASTVQYPETPIAKKLKGIAQVHMANFGTRIFYCDHGSFDSHSNQHGMHDKLWKDVSEGVACFFDDLKEHGVGDNVIMLMFSNLAAAPVTTARAPTTVPVGWPLSWASGSRAGSTASSPP